VVNIITKSGTNHLHGSVFEFLRNDLFDARNFFNRAIDPSGNHIPKSEFRNNQFGISLGGPVIKDKTFFFGAYEGQRERVTSDFTFFVPGINPALPPSGSALPNQITAAQALVSGNGTAPEPGSHQHADKVFPGAHRVQRLDWNVGGRGTRHQRR
jgi:hypothetical protein